MPASSGTDASWRRRRWLVRNTPLRRQIDPAINDGRSDHRRSQRFASIFWPNGLMVCVYERNLDLVRSRRKTSDDERPAAGFVPRPTARHQPRHGGARCGATHRAPSGRTPDDLQIFTARCLSIEFGDDNASIAQQWSCQLSDPANAFEPIDQPKRQIVGSYPRRWGRNIRW